MEGQSITRPPFFNGNDYGYWKIRMTIYLQQMDFDIWNIIKDGYKIPMIIKENEAIVKEKKDWDENDKKNFTTNTKVMNILFCALNRN